MSLSVRKKLLEVLQDALINANNTATTRQVSHDHLEAISELAHTGLSPDAVSFGHRIDAETVQVQQQKLQAPQLHQATLPTFIYSYVQSSDQLHRTNLVTGEHSSYRVPPYILKWGCRCNELPEGSLLFIGGGDPALRDVVRIDTRREFAVTQWAPMLTPRNCLAAVYHTPHLYVLGGQRASRSILSECERYVCAENRWQALPPLPRACSHKSGVVVESSLYALGGYDGSALDLVQKLSLENLTWELMQFRLPHAGFGIPCFKLRDTEVYLVVNQTLWSFTAFDVRPLKTLTEAIYCYYGVSYYRRGTLYCFSDHGAARDYELGSLGN
jgi:hypothetical protein